MLGHLSDGADAGSPPSALDAASVVVLVGRSWLRWAVGQIPLAMAGLPVLALCLAAYASIYENQFEPWDMMAEVPSRPDPVAALRRAVDLGWLILVPIGLVSGWRVARRLRRGSFLGPGLYLGALLTLVTQADLFVERNRWFGHDLRASDVDSVTPQAVVLMGLAFAVPLAFVAIDTAAEARRGLRSPTPAVLGGRAGHGVDGLAVAAVASPLLVLLGAHLWPALFLLLTWLAPTFSRPVRIAATAGLALPWLGLGLAVVTGAVDDPPVLLVVPWAATLVGLWAWMFSLALGWHRSPG